jgi:multidrug resistance efflux pump
MTSTPTIPMAAAVKTETMRTFLRVLATDNAYVRGQTTFISPQVNGYITEVKVQDFVQVKKSATADRLF